MMGSSQTGTELSPLELIFCCGICLESVRDIYQTPLSNNDLGGPGKLNHGVVIQFWLTECGHLTCSKHLEGGGAPFHPANAPSRVKCPVCASQGQDPPEVDIFPVQGINDGFYDARIPATYFQDSFGWLDAPDAKTGALRFHLLTLLENAALARRIINELKRERSTLRGDLQTATTQSDKLKAEVDLLTPRVTALEEKAVKLQAWENREPAIRQNLKLVKPLVEENEFLKRQLEQLVSKPPHETHTLPLSRTNGLILEARGGGPGERYTQQGGRITNQHQQYVAKVNGELPRPEQHQQSAVRSQTNERPEGLSWVRNDLRVSSQSSPIKKTSSFLQHSNKRKRPSPEAPASYVHPHRDAFPPDSRGLMPPPPVPRPNPGAPRTPVKSTREIFQGRPTLGDDGFEFSSGMPAISKPTLGFGAQSPLLDERIARHRMQFDVMNDVRPSDNHPTQKQMTRTPTVSRQQLDRPTRASDQTRLAFQENTINTSKSLPTRKGPLFGNIAHALRVGQNSSPSHSMNGNIGHSQPHYQLVTGHGGPAQGKSSTSQPYRQPASPTGAALGLAESRYREAARSPRSHPKRPESVTSPFFAARQSNPAEGRTSTSYTNTVSRMPTNSYRATNGAPANSYAQPSRSHGSLPRQTLDGWAQAPASTQIMATASGRQRPGTDIQPAAPPATPFVSARYMYSPRKPQEKVASRSGPIPPFNQPRPPDPFKSQDSETPYWLRRGISDTPGDESARQPARVTQSRVQEHSQGLDLGHFLRRQDYENPRDIVSSSGRRRVQR